MRREVLAIDPTQPVHSITTMSELLGSTVAPDRLSMWLLGALAGLALMLSAAGVYGVMTYGVRAQTHEIGVRMALGSAQRAVAMHVLRRGGGLLAMGVVVGAGLAWVASRAMSALLYEVSPTQPASYLVATVLLSTALLLACWLPARRAARVDPAIALRS